MKGVLSFINNSHFIKQRLYIAFGVLFFNSTSMNAQSWVPDEDGINPANWVQSTILDIHFFQDGPNGKDWIYGKWQDSDSVLRYAAYREGGKWIPLPVTGRMNGGGATTMEKYGDTLYIGGIFTGAVIKQDTVPQNYVTIIKCYQDSIWYSDERIDFIGDFAVSGDSLLVATSSTYYSPTDTFGPHLLTTNGITWSDPFSVHLPSSQLGLGGVWNRVEIHNGSIYAINFPADDTFNGVIKWDGQQWRTFGQGIYGLVSQVYDFAFYNNELYIGGSFTKNEDPRNPGEHIARWNGVSWTSVGGGSPAPAWSFFEHDGYLYCHIRDSVFGDANIPYLAAWNGLQWCGTDITYSGGDPPLTFGFANDTLWAVFKYPGAANGSPLGLINYFDGDYINGPNSICSTSGLGTRENLTVQEIQVYPNPGTDKLNIILPKDFDSAKYELLTLDGKLITEGTLVKGQSTIYVSEPLSGVFVLKIEMDGGLVLKKVVFEN